MKTIRCGGQEDRQQKIGDRDGWSSGMNEGWFSQTNVCKPNFTVHHYFTFNPRTVNRRSCYNLVLKLSRDLARGAMAKPSDRLSNLRNPWVEVLVFWSSMRAPSMKPHWRHTAGWLNPHPAIAPQWPTDGSWSILCFQSGDPGLAPTTQHWLFCSSCSVLQFWHWCPSIFSDGAFPVPCVLYPDTGD